MAGKFVPFEKSSKDVEPKGMVEGSPKEEALDRKQASAGRGKKHPGFKGIALANGGKIKPQRG